jgi:dipeptidyl aminopeptidase/acylaminoacyl peptidase
MRIHTKPAALLLCVLGVLIVLASSSCKPRKAAVISASSPEYRQIFDEVMSVEVVSRPPVPSSSGDILVNIKNARHGREISLVNLRTLEEKSVTLSNDVRRVGGWSPDGRYLALEQRPKAFRRVLKETSSRGLEEDRDESWLTVFDSRSKLIWRLTTNSGVNEKWFVWLTPTTFFYSSDSDDKGLRGTYWGVTETRVIKKISPTLHQFVRMTGTKAAYVKDDNIYTFEIEPGKDVNRSWPKPVIQKASDFKSGDFDSIRWLRYCSETSSFLFCARPGSSTWRYLFRFDPEKSVLTQLSREDTYNGQWLQPGSGFAYVGNSNNSFFLAIRAADPAKSTNLFTRGSVANYTVTPRGDKLYATAAQGMEPQALWEYDIDAMRLRQVTQGSKVAFVASRIVEAEESRAKSFDGLEVPYFLFAPVRREQRPAGFFSRGEKHPAVIYIPPQSFQMQRVYSPRAQIMANLGFYFIAVNYRGCDGYGKDYAAMDDPGDGAKDVLAVYRSVIRKHPIDKENVFLLTSSYGNVVTYETLIAAPKLWRGAAFMHPGTPPIERLPASLPAMYLRSWSGDPNLSEFLEFERWAIGNELDVVLEVNTDDEHIDFTTLNAKERQDHINRFMLDRLR